MRVTVFGSVCVSECVSVKSHLTYGVSVHHSVGNKDQKISGDLPQTTVFKSYVVIHEQKNKYVNYSDLATYSQLSPLDGQQKCQRLPNN